MRDGRLTGHSVGGFGGRAPRDPRRPRRLRRPRQVPPSSWATRYWGRSAPARAPGQLPDSISSCRFAPQQCRLESCRSPRLTVIEREAAERVEAAASIVRGRPGRGRDRKAQPIVVGDPTLERPTGDVQLVPIFPEAGRETWTGNPGPRGNAAWPCRRRRRSRQASRSPPDRPGFVRIGLMSGEREPDKPAGTAMAHLPDDLRRDPPGSRASRRWRRTPAARRCPRAGWRAAPAGSADRGARGGTINEAEQERAPASAVGEASGRG